MDEASKTTNAPSHPRTSQPIAVENARRFVPGVSRENESSTAMDGRGEQSMGFSQTATTHHFLIRPTGGVIQVETNDAADVATRNHIRMHLTHIVTAFANGDFAIPMFVHDTVPPGVSVMKQRSDKITYTFEETATGGRVVITTTDPHALAAVQQFLRFQIAEHKTGDPTAIPSAPSTAR
jgi:hypothetical protein